LIRLFAACSGEETRRRVAGGESRKLKLKQAENSNLFTL